MQSIRGCGRLLQKPISSTIVRRGANNVQRVQRHAFVVVNRTYASSSGAGKKASSDLPWLAAAAIVTIPGVFYVLQPSSGAHHDDHAQHGAHDTSHEQADHDTESESDNPAETSGTEQSGNDHESQAGTSTEDSSSDSDDSRGTKVEGVNFAGGSKKRESDAKGATKVRIDSDQAKNIGEGISSGTDDDMSEKQRGLTNTDTRHSIDVSQDPTKSKKGEGTAETAKVKGTVKPDRPQV